MNVTVRDDPRGKARPADTSAAPVRPRLLDALRVPRVGAAPGRDLGVDAVRGFSILVVVLGHAIANAENLMVAGKYSSMLVVSKFLYTFHMPLFFLISGYVLSGRRVRVGDRAIRLLVPWVAWVPVYWLVNHYIHDWPASFLTSLKDNIVHPAVGLWFLPTLFLCSLVLLPARRLESWRSWSVPAFLAAAFLVVSFLPFDQFGVGQLKYFFPYFAAGYLLATYRGWIERAGRAAVDAVLFGCSAAFLLLFALLYYCGWINPYKFPFSLSVLFSDPAIYIFRYGMAALGIAFAITIVRAARIRPVRNGLAWLGLLTLDIYVSHFLLLQLTLGSGWLKVFVSVVTGTVLSLALSLLVLRQWRVSALLFLGIRPGPGRGRLSAAGGGGGVDGGDDGGDDGDGGVEAGGGCGVEAGGCSRDPGLDGGNDD